MFIRSAKVTTTIVRPGDLIPDNRLLPDDADLLEHEAIADAVAEIALTATTPVNIALFGAWGAGKSSIYTMVEKHLDAIAPRRVRVVRYDAWKYGGKELKRNFVDSLATDLGLTKDPELSAGLERPVTDTRIALHSWFWKNKSSLLLGLLFAVAVAVLWVISIALAAEIFTDSGFGDTAKGLIPQVGTVFGLALLAALLGPKMLEGATVTTVTPAPDGADQFAKRFQKLVTKARHNSPYPLVIFIDELDRCAPADVVATLRDLKTFLDQPNCAFIVAADREVIVRALREEVPQAKPVREEEPYYATPGAFLDKIFQHQITLPPLRARALTEFAQALADAQQGGVWGEMRGAGCDCYDRTIFALIPVHVRSPRRIKVLMNNFATNARIAQGRGVPWLLRVHEIAVLTVLQTEFPAVVSDLRRVPRLLTYVRGEEKPTSDEVDEIVSKYTNPRPAETAPGTSTGISENAPGDEIIDDDNSPAGKRIRQSASETLRLQLSNYLSKIAAARIQDPRPDLLYLKPAANRDRLPDPKLGDAIDFASDTAPEQVVAAFQGQTSSALAIAVPLLVIEGDNAVGLGKQFAYESACRLIERLDADDFRDVADQTHPSLMAAVNAGALSDDSLPGALLVAAWSGAAEVIRKFFDTEHARDLSEDLLQRLTVLLPHVEQSDAADIVRLLADRFETAPEPLLTALGQLPVSVACDMWAEVASSVIETINELELPTSDSAEDAPAEAPTPTGKGIARLERLVEVALGRTEGESLVSDIFASFQTRPAKTPIVQWTLSHADRVVAPMASSTRRARHALLGIDAFQSAAWHRWAELLPDAPGGTPNEAVAGLAARLVRRKLVPAFATSASKLPPADLAELTRRVAGWASPNDDHLAEAARLVLDKLKWSDTDSRENLWSTKQSLYQVLLDLTTNPGLDGLVASIVIDDLTAVLSAYELDQSVVEPFIHVCDALAPELVAAVSERLDAYEVAQGEHAALLLLRLSIRGRCGEQPIPVSELLRLQESERTTAISSAWLELAPDSDEVAKLIPAYPVRPAALEKYADSLTPECRTTLWIEAEKSKLTERLLAAIGQAGVGSEAVDYIRREVAELSREPARSDMVKRLRLATPLPPSIDSGSVQRAAASLARNLLDSGVSGDVRSAAELMCWAGGAARGTKTELRELFDRQIKAHRNSFTKTLFSQLEELGLVSKRKSLRETIFGSHE